MSYKRFEEMPVWQKARLYNKEIFAITLREGLNTDYKFKDQIRGSAGSIMDNISEGYERDGNKELINFLHYAKGSAGENCSQLCRAFDCNYITREEFEDLYKKAIDISKEIKSFISYLQNSEHKGIKYK